MVISSTGIALALLGTFLLNYADQHTAQPAGLDWVGLIVDAPQLDPEVTRIAVALLIIGFGTKAGLAPLHAWLPDAYSQAPTPVAALMSGVLSSVAFYAVLRVKVIADAALGADFARALLLVVALASLAVAASLMLGQRDYKRMLAYSSIENMGLLALGAAIGSPLAIAAVLLHILGHGLVKSTLFIGAGRLLQLTGTSRIDRVRGLAARAPVLAGCLGIGILALIGFPPFSLFASEFGIARAGFVGGLGDVTAAALLLVLVIAASLLVHTSRMLLGGAPAGGTAAAGGGAADARGVGGGVDGALSPEVLWSARPRQRATEMGLRPVGFPRWRSPRDSRSRFRTARYRSARCRSGPVLVRRRAAQLRQRPRSGQSRCSPPRQAPDPPARPDSQPSGTSPAPTCGRWPGH